MSKTGTSMSWTKIVEDGWDGKSWAVDKLKAGSYTGTPGQHTFKIPHVASGPYTIRPEIIALHEADRVGGAQFYMECVSDLVAPWHGMYSDKQALTMHFRFT